MLNKHTITKINVAEMTHQMNTYIMELNRSVQQLSDEIEKIQKHPNTNENILNRLEQILASLDSNKKAMEGLVKQFEREAGTKTEFWSGPGMRSFSVLSEMEAIGDKISNQGDELNKLTPHLGP